MIVVCLLPLSRPKIPVLLWKGHQRAPRDASLRPLPPRRGGRDFIVRASRLYRYFILYIVYIPQFILPNELQLK